MSDWSGTALEWFILALVVANGLWIAPLILECFAALWPNRRESSASDTKGSSPSGEPQDCCILVPAHDEETLLGATLASLRADLERGHRLLVVAHNCSDRTEAVARESATDVLTVEDGGGGGKASAVRAGLEFLARDPARVPDVVILVDADCHVAPDAVRLLLESVRRSGRPVQGAYTFQAGADDGLALISSLSLLIKNWVRPLGLMRLGRPNLITGSGCAFPFALLHSVPLGQGSIAEDTQLSIDLARRGQAACFCPDAKISSCLPKSHGVARSQRRRWEHGHIDLMLREAPRLLRESIRRRNLDLFTLALEVAVPPLSLWLLSWGIATTSALAMSLSMGRSLPLEVSVGFGALLFLALVSNWMHFLGLAPTLRACLHLPRYVLWKLPLLAGFVVDRERTWLKTSREI